MNRIEQNGSRGLDRIVTPVGMGGSHEATYPPSERSGLATNLHESTRTGIRENPCPSVANTSPRLYAHDGNKNVSEVVAAASGTNATVEVVAHYDYAAFGAVVAQKGDCAEANPWRFSSEYEDTELGLDYYNYRHYEPVMGRWLARDPIEELGGDNLYAGLQNPLTQTDSLGRIEPSSFLDGITDIKKAMDLIRQHFPNDPQRQKDELRRLKKKLGLRKSHLQKIFSVTKKAAQLAKFCGYAATVMLQVVFTPLSGGAEPDMQSYEWYKDTEEVMGSDTTKLEQNIEKAKEKLERKFEGMMNGTP